MGKGARGVRALTLELGNELIDEVDRAALLDALVGGLLETHRDGGAQRRGRRAGREGQKERVRAGGEEGESKEEASHYCESAQRQSWPWAA